MNVKAEHELLERKMRFFTKESAVDMQEMDEALAIVREVCMSCGGIYCSGASFVAVVAMISLGPLSTLSLVWFFSLP